jgi:hypothetical protein
MSLTIDIPSVDSFLLKNGEWYQVWNKTFDIDAYEFGWYDENGENRFELLHQPDSETTGFSAVVSHFEHNGVEKQYRIFGPLSSIVAIGYEKGVRRLKGPE